MGRVYFINTGTATSVSATSSEHIDAFVNDIRIYSLTEEFAADWLTMTAEIGCILMLMFGFAGLVLYGYLRRQQGSSSAA